MKKQVSKLFLIYLILFSLLGLPVFIYAHAEESPRDSRSETSDIGNPLDNMRERREEIKKQVEEMRNKSGEKKEKAKEIVLAKIKQAALKAIDSTINKLNRIKNRVSKMKVISDDQKAELNSKIDARIEVLRSTRGTVEAATTKEEVRAALGESQKEVRSTLEIVKNIVEAIHKTHLENIVERLKKVLEKLETKAKDLEETDGENVDSLITEANSAIASANSDISAGNLKEAKENIKRAHKLIRKILSAIKNKSKNKKGGDNE